jgi:hypothetical protein
MLLPADVFITDFHGRFAIYARAESLDLNANAIADTNINALDSLGEEALSWANVRRRRNARF